MLPSVAPIKAVLTPHGVPETVTVLPDGDAEGCGDGEGEGEGCGGLAARTQADKANIIKITKENRNNLFMTLPLPFLKKSLFGCWDSHACPCHPLC
jgi:hypothetical protein